MEDSKTILIAGCGGGYDMFSGLPLFFALQKLGKTVYMGNLAFTHGLDEVTGRKFGPVCVEVTADTVRNGKWTIERESYFPELMLSRWFRAKRSQEVPVYTFSRDFGLVQLRESYEALVEELKLDTIILADGGTDSLMQGDEFELGTPTEDMMSIGAVYYLNQARKKDSKVPLKLILSNLGFGVDTFHGVSHGLYLQNVAELQKAKQGNFLGVFSLLPEHSEAQSLEEAYLACLPDNSIVTSSVCSAVQGQFGDYHHPATKNRTVGSKLFISPLMSMYWMFDLEAVAERVKYMDKIKDAKSGGEIRTAINKWRGDHVFAKGKFNGRPDTKIPH